MNFKKSTTTLATIIIVLSIIASSYGIFSRGGEGKHEIKTFRGETVELYGRGLYKNESVSMASQAIAQDVVTLCLGVPLLIAALVLARKGLIKGQLLLTGILGYFLYTYGSYSFYAMYNSMFLIYVVLMSASFFSFVLAMMSFEPDKIESYFNLKLPVKFVGGVLIFIAVMVGLMWLKRIVTPLMTGAVPEGLEHYTTLIIQAFDLGFVLPAGVLAGVLLIKRKAYGYLLATVLIIKEAALLTVIIAMLISQATNGVKVGKAEFVMFPIFALLVIYCMVLILRNVNEPDYALKG